ncbi:hypothetical protein G5V59_11745 [Nocardioides sp. W3-2-3]|uniref:hypothetical protein n=1 Tax=Nocardioides convexus TaxID=2712224 RepID=UPI0024182AAF|nr:hypothetical protein [Nocardioides convexus]NHA00476.1 hypothetical protein [Nocardioides convexus]
MCQTYEGRVQRLDYKTMRYPGHFEQMHFLFDETRPARAARGGGPDPGRGQAAGQRRHRLPPRRRRGRQERHAVPREPRARLPPDHAHRC